MVQRLGRDPKDVEFIQHRVDRMWFAHGRRAFPEGQDDAFICIVDEHGTPAGHVALNRV